MLGKEIGDCFPDGVIMFPAFGVANAEVCRSFTKTKDTMAFVLGFRSLKVFEEGKACFEKGSSMEGKVYYTGCHNDYGCRCAKSTYE